MLNKITCPPVGMAYVSPGPMPDMGQIKARQQIGRAHV